MNDINLNLPVIWKWGKRVGFSILDQGLFSGANFAVNILLARWLTPEKYGAFAVAFAIMLILAGVQSSFVYEPMMVYGPTKYKNHLSQYIRKVNIFQITITVSLSVFVIISTFFLHGETKNAILGMGFSMPFILSMWFFRQSCYLESRSGLSSIASFIYFLFILSGLILLFKNDQLSFLTIYSLLSISSLVGILIISSVFNQTKTVNNAKLTIKDILRTHWNYGRWILSASISNSIANLIIAPVFSIYQNLEQTGAYKAYQNLITPISQVLAGLGLYSLPRLSREREETGLLKTKVTFYKTIILYATFTIAYLLPIHFFGRQIINLLYQKRFYSSFEGLFPFIELIILLSMVNSVLGIRARYLEFPKAIFYSKLLSAIFTLLSISYLISKWGLKGAFIVTIIALVGEAIVLLLIKPKNKFGFEYDL